MRRTIDIDVDDLLRSLRTVDAPTEPDEITTRILDAAGELFVTHGIRRCSVEDIAEHSGLGRTTVYRRFDGRSQIIEAVLARECHRFFTSILSSTAHHTDFQDLVVEGFLTGLKAAETSLLSALVRTEPELQRVLTIDAEPVISTARDFLVLSYGPVRSDEVRAQVRAVAELLVRLAISLVVAPASAIPLQDDDAARRALHQLFDPLTAPLAALRHQPSPTHA